MKRSLFLATTLASALLLASCTREVVVTPTPPSPPVAPNTLSVANAYYEAFNARDVEALSAVFADEIVFSVDGPPHLTGKAAVLGAHLGGEFPLNPQVTLSNPSVEGNTVKGEHSWKAESGLLLTGNVEIMVEDGKITSFKVTLDEESREKLGHGS